MLGIADGETVAFLNDLNSLVGLVETGGYAAARGRYEALIPALHAEREDFKAIFMKKAPGIALKVTSFAAEDKRCSYLARDLFLTAVECFKGFGHNLEDSGFYGVPLLEGGAPLFQELALHDGNSAVGVFSALVAVGTTLKQTDRVFDFGCTSLPALAGGQGSAGALSALVTSLCALAGKDSDKLKLLAGSVQRTIPAAVAAGKEEILDVILQIEPSLKQVGLGAEGNHLLHQGLWAAGELPHTPCPTLEALIKKIPATGPLAHMMVMEAACVAMKVAGMRGGDRSLEAHSLLKTVEKRLPPEEEGTRTLLCRAQSALLPHLLRQHSVATARHAVDDQLRALPEEDSRNKKPDPSWTLEVAAAVVESVLETLPAFAEHAARGLGEDRRHAQDVVRLLSSARVLDALPDPDQVVRPAYVRKTLNVLPAVARVYGFPEMGETLVRSLASVMRATPELGAVIRDSIPPNFLTGSLYPPRVAKAFQELVVTHLPKPHLSQHARLGVRVGASAMPA